MTLINIQKAIILILNLIYIELRAIFAVRAWLSLS